MYYDNSVRNLLIVMLGILNGTSIKNCKINDKILPRSYFFKLFWKTYRYLLQHLLQVAVINVFQFFFESKQLSVKPNQVSNG